MVVLVLLVESLSHAEIAYLCPIEIVSILPNYCRCRLQIKIKSFSTCPSHTSAINKIHGENFVSNQNIGNIHHSPDPWKKMTVPECVLPVGGMAFTANFILTNVLNNLLININTKCT